MLVIRVSISLLALLLGATSIYNESQTVIHVVKSSHDQVTANHELFVSGCDGPPKYYIMGNDDLIEDFPGGQLPLSYIPELNACLSSVRDVKLLKSLQVIL